LGREQASYSSGPMPVALFLLPPSEPDVHLFSASGSPAVRFRKVERSRMSACNVSALRTCAPPIPDSRHYLSPFAMYRTFSGSDYYDNSVTMSLSAFRSSRVFSQSDVKRAFAVGFCPFYEFLTRTSSRRAFLVVMEPPSVLGQPHKTADVLRCIRYKCATDGQRITGWDSPLTIQFHASAQDSQSLLPYTLSGVLHFHAMLCSHRGFPLEYGKACVLKVVLSTSPASPESNCPLMRRTARIIIFCIGRPKHLQNELVKVGQSRHMHRFRLLFRLASGPG